MNRFALLPATAALLVAISAPAHATPSRDTFPLVCDIGQTYNVSFNEQGNWSAIRETTGTASFIQVAYDITGVTRDAGGAVVQTFNYVDKKEGSHTYDASCTFSFRHVSDGTNEPAGYTLTVDGTLWVRITPRGPAA